MSAAGAAAAAAQALLWCTCVKSNLERQMFVSEVKL